MVDKIYLVYENSDKIEGRGPMVRVFDSGFFTDEEEAWQFANTLSGVMGRKPKGGDWRNENWGGDVEVRVIHRHSKEREEVRRKIKQLREQANKLEQELLG